MSPDRGLGMSPDQGLGMSPDKGLGMSPDRGLGMSPDEGLKIRLSQDHTGVGVHVYVHKNGHVPILLTGVCGI